MALHPKFHRETLGPREQIFADGRYVLYDNQYSGSGPASPVGPLVDEHTGQQRMLALPSGCGPNVVIGGPWLVFQCSSQQAGSWLELYGLPSGTWRSLPMLTAPCSPNDYPGYCWATPTEVGGDWIEYVELDCYHCTVYRRFENVWNGSARADPSNATTVPDLSLPGLARKLCAPLRVPTEDNDLPIYDSFTFFGPFGVAYQPRLDPDRPGPWEGSAVQRCGSHNRIGNGALGNRHLLLLNSLSANQLNGQFLPHGPRFTLSLPPGAAEQVTGGPGDVALSDRTLFIGTELVASGPGAPNTLWVAHLPLKPTPPKRH